MKVRLRTSDQSGVCTDWVWLSWQGCQCCCWMHSSLTADCSSPASNKSCGNVATSGHPLTTLLSHEVSVSVGMMYPVTLMASVPQHCSGHHSSPRCVSAQSQVRTGQWLHSASLGIGSVHRDTRPARLRLSSDNPLRKMLIKTLQS